MLKTACVLLASITLTGAAFGGPKCTEEAKDKWKNQDEFKKSLEEQGYKIKKFKVTSGNCYEIYGWDKAGKKVEIYFNPITGDKVKEEVGD